MFFDFSVKMTNAKLKDFARLVQEMQETGLIVPIKKILRDKE